MAIRVAGVWQGHHSPCGEVHRAQQGDATPCCAAAWLPLAQIDPILMVIGCLIIIGVLLMRFQKRTSRANSAPDFHPPRRVDSSVGREDRSTLEGFEVQMHELARELTGRVDTKLAALQQLLLMVDERMAALDEKLARLDATLASLQSSQGQAAAPADQVSADPSGSGSSTETTL